MVEGLSGMWRPCIKSQFREKNKHAARCSKYIPLLCSYYHRLYRAGLQKQNFLLNKNSPVLLSISTLISASVDLNTLKTRAKRDHTVFSLSVIGSVQALCVGHRQHPRPACKGADLTFPPPVLHSPFPEALHFPGSQPSLFLVLRLPPQILST